MSQEREKLINCFKVHNHVIFLAIFGFIARLYRPKGKILKENRIVFSNLSIFGPIEGILLGFSKFCLFRGFPGVMFRWSESTWNGL